MTRFITKKSRLVYEAGLSGVIYMRSLPANIVLLNKPLPGGIVENIIEITAVDQCGGFQL